jgi:hypothetical protein
MAIGYLSDRAAEEITHIRMIKTMIESRETEVSWLTSVSVRLHSVKQKYQPQLAPLCLRLFRLRLRILLIVYPCMACEKFFMKYAPPMEPPFVVIITQKKDSLGLGVYLHALSGCRDLNSGPHGPEVSRLFRMLRGAWILIKQIHAFQLKQLRGDILS